MTTDSQHPRDVTREANDAKVARPSGVIKGLTLRGAEVVLALVLVLFFFLTFVGIIGFIFPEGTGFTVLVSPSEWILEQPTPSDVGLDEGDATLTLAWLAETRRLVKVKDSAVVAWSNARSGMSLRNRHAVQTLANAEAVISFGEDNKIDLGADSLIVIRRPEREVRRALQTTVVLDGALAVYNDPEPTTSEPLEIMAANGASAILPEGAVGSRLRITQNPDKTTTFALDSGTAEIVSGGRSITLTPNLAVTVDGAAPPGAPVVLPGRPSLAAPPDGFAYEFRATPPRLRFAWRDQPDGAKYRIEIARDAGFRDVVFEDRLAGTEFVHGNLRPGSYYWRVSAMRDWVAGPPSAARRLELVRDEQPPPLQVEFPVGPVYEDQVLLKGTTEPGAQVLIGDWSTAADPTGTFEYALSLQRGVTLVVVEALDAAGNVSYRSDLINAKY